MELLIYYNYLIFFKNFIKGDMVKNIHKHLLQEPFVF